MKITRPPKGGTPSPNPPRTVRTKPKQMELEGKDLVEEAARKAPKDPGASRTLSDQRDRTTGADQATRTDMGRVRKKK